MGLDFTSDFLQIQKVVKRLRTSGGGDEPEAVLDALVAAKARLSWRPEAKRIVVLIGDAPPHPTTSKGLEEAAVIADYQAIGTEISVYPVFSAKGKT